MRIYEVAEEGGEPWIVMEALPGRTLEATLRSRDRPVLARGTGVAPSTVTGVGAGTLLTGFALAALAGRRAEETSQPGDPRTRR